jgi:SAM-dependent methyltransferase
MERNLKTVKQEGLSVTLLRRCIPNSLARVFKRVTGIYELEERVSAIEELVFPAEQLWELSKSRWQSAKPDVELTWGKNLKGDAFVKRVLTQLSDTQACNVLEIGPGYGRLLESWCRAGGTFNRYVGVDLSPQNISLLKDKFKFMAKAEFICGDIETLRLDEQYEVVMSSLTFKHLYPTFENGLKNVSRFVKQQGLIFFDVPEGLDKRWQARERTYLRAYSRDEIAGILGRVRLDLLGFEEVKHAPGYSRLLVIARKPS